MAKKDAGLAKPIVHGLAPIRAEILHSTCYGPFEPVVH